MPKFDITKHNWYCPTNDISFEGENNSILCIADSRGILNAVINKDDAIAIAKHFGLLDNELTKGQKYAIEEARVKHGDRFVVPGVNYNG